MAVYLKRILRNLPDTSAVKMLLYFFTSLLCVGDVDIILIRLKSFWVYCLVDLSLSTKTNASSLHWIPVV